MPHRTHREHGRKLSHRFFDRLQTLHAEGVVFREAIAVLIQNPVFGFEIDFCLIPHIARKIHLLTFLS